MKRTKLVCCALLLAPLVAVAIVDSNHNGLSDLWEKEYSSGFPGSFDPQGDDDGDGWTNAEEAAAGTDPLSANSPDGIIRPDIVHTPQVMGEENGLPVVVTPEAVTVSWPTLAGKRYTLSASPDLSPGSWIEVPGWQFIGEGDIHDFSYETDSGDNCFWRVAVTDIDTDGDGFTDSEEHSLGSDPASATSDGDHDGLTDAEEYQLGTNPNKADSDDDGTGDGDDAVPTDKAIWWPRTPKPRYAIVATGIPTGEFDDLSMPIDIDRNGEILVKFDPAAPRGDWGIWSPATGQIRDVTPPVYYARSRSLPFESSISDSRIAEDGSHHVSLIYIYFTDRMSIFLPPGAASQPPSADDWLLHFPGSRDAAPPMLSYHVDTVDTWSLSTKWDPTAQEFTWKSRHLVGGNWSDAESDAGSFADAPLSISPEGAVLFKDRIERPGQSDLSATGDPFDSLSRLGSVWVPDPTPTDFGHRRPVSVVIHNESIAPALWVETPDGQSLLASSHSFLPDTGSIAENGVALTGSGIWLDGAIYSPEELVSPSGWSGIRPVALSTNGLIAATARWNATGLREIVLLEPVAVRALTSLQWDGNTPYDPKGLAKGIDRMSGFASGGGGRTYEFWINAPTGGGSTVARFLTAANPLHNLGMDAAPHYSDTLASPDVFTTVSGSGTATVDVPVTFKSSGNLEAANHPVQLKVMKKRTVKVALHEVMGLDGNGNPPHPLFMPDPVNLTSYLNQVYGPQVNVNFVVSSPFVEAGPGDANNDGILDAADSDDVTAATPNAKVGAVGSDFNIDVWVVGGVRLEAPPKVGIYPPDHLFGVTVGPPGTEGRKILIDGDMAGFSEVPAGKQTHHLHFTIAHEIGHVITADSHPGETGYQSELEWYGGQDPNLRRRLMGSGASVDHAHPEVCLIKKEWDRIETWLHANVDPNLN